MDTKKLIDSFIKGEITQEQFDAETEKLSPEEKVQLEKDAEAAKPSAVETIKSLRRGADKVKEKTPEDDSFVKKLRDENLTKAKNTFFSQIGIVDDSAKAVFEEGFKKYDSGAVNPENIIEDMKAYHAAQNKDEYFRLLAEKREREAQAAEFEAQQAGATGSGAGGDGGEKKKVSKEIQALMDAAKKAGRPMTVEAAERALKVLKNKGHIV